MQQILIKLFKGGKLFFTICYGKISYIRCSLYFYLNGIEVGSFKCKGVPYIHKSFNAKCIIGDYFVLNNGVQFSELGINGKCRIEVRDNAILLIGNRVGISDVTVSCHDRIEIGDNVLIGVGTQIRDTDNHSLNPKDWYTYKDWENKKTAPIIIGNNVFIGSNCTILKGVTIGSNAIIGAGSIVTKNVPSYEIWAGNPAKFIRKVELV